jgi:L-aspartate semialdehyde sulfurtransferase ferredoxin
MTVSKKIVLHFPKRLVDRPIVSRLVKDFDLDFKIVKASITPDQEGLLVMELTGERRDFDNGIRYLTDAGVQMQDLSQDVVRNEDRCTSCGACVTVCPAGAFEVDLRTREVTFDNGKCLACELCLKACPPRAMELHF